MDKELDEKLQAYKASLSDEDIQNLVERTKQLVEYQESEDLKEDMEKIPVLGRDDISKEIAPIYNEEIKVGDVTDGASQRRDKWNRICNFDV